VKDVLDKHAFESMLSSMGFHTDELKESEEKVNDEAEESSIFDTIYKAFDRDCDGFINS
jgi:hypothetical protein